MTSTWTLTARTAGAPTTISGQAATPDDAAQTARSAVRDAIGAAAVHTTYYELDVDGQLMAIIDTGLADDGRPDHRQTMELVDRLSDAPAHVLPWGLAGGF
jgi:hypothetical protein